LRPGFEKRSAYVGRSRVMLVLVVTTPRVVPHVTLGASGHPVTRSIERYDDRERKPSRGKTTIEWGGIAEAGATASAIHGPPTSPTQVD
jgi:hypothetical protein